MIDKPVRLSHDDYDRYVAARQERDALAARLAEAEALLEIVAPLAYAQWKSGSCCSVEAVVGLNEPITGIADSADGGEK